MNKEREAEKDEEIKNFVNNFYQNLDQVKHDKYNTIYTQFNTQAQEDFAFLQSFHKKK